MGLSGVARFALLALCAAAVACTTPPPLPPPEMFHENFAGKSAEFRTVNRKRLDSCLNPSPYLSINVGTGGAPIPDEAFLQVTVAGVRRPDGNDWVAMITPSNSR
jgi:acid phosphatase type 7